jgi:hypothetical protein
MMLRAKALAREDKAAVAKTTVCRTSANGFEKGLSDVNT